MAMMRIERAEVIPLEVPLTRTFYGGTYSMNRPCCCRHIGGGQEHHQECRGEEKSCRGKG